MAAVRGVVAVVAVEVAAVTPDAAVDATLSLSLLSFRNKGWSPP